MPRSASQVDWEMAMVLPLGVLATQLVKIEGDLRFLSMKAAEHSEEDEARPTKAVDVRLDVIHEVLDSINALLLRLQSDMHPKRPITEYRSHEPVDSSALKRSSDQDD